MKTHRRLAGILLVFTSTSAYAQQSGATQMNAIPLFWWIAPISALIGLGTAWYFYRQMLKMPEGTDRMKEIAGYVREGAMAYVRRQYTTVTLVFGGLFVLLATLAYFGIQNVFVPVAFLTGGFFSGLCGYLGMITATRASARTAQGASENLNRGLQAAFRSGAVMGLVVVGFGLLDISLWYIVLNVFFDNNLFGLGMRVAEHVGLAENAGVWNPEWTGLAEFQHRKLVEITTTMLTFGMGASTQALFARVGGGIFTKAADVGADLVGKVEEGIPEDDPRNPATIADNVGDNVGDVAGMGADLYESYCGSILATAALGAALPVAAGTMSGVNAVIAPMIVAGLGIILSILGVLAVRCKDDASMRTLLRALLAGTLGSSLLVLAVVAGMAALGLITWGVFGAVVSGLLAGVLIGQATEYFTSDEFKPTRGIAEQAQMGPATTIIEGLSVGMFSAALPIVVIVVGILCAFGSAGGFADTELGLYGIGFAAVGMLATLGITLATDAYGPIADNAGGNAEMAGLPPEVRERTDALDMLGNTTAATGKGFAIGSAALTAMALLAAYLMEVEVWAMKLRDAIPFPADEYRAALAGGHRVDFFVKHFELNVMNPLFLTGIFLGAMMAFVFCAMTIKAVGRAAGEMVEEVRRQFKATPGIMEGTEKPDYARCVAISTTDAQKEMVLPSLMAIIVPVAAGLVLGVAGVLGLLTGGLTCGFVLACTLNNAGGAWDNAKKHIEKGHFGGKGSDAHRAGVVGDTVGDPCKDTAGPSLNILIKLMSMVSVVFTPVVVRFSPAVREWLGMMPGAN